MRPLLPSSHDGDALLALDDALEVVGAARVVALLGEAVDAAAAVLGRRSRRGRSRRRRESDARVVVRV